MKSADTTNKPGSGGPGALPVVLLLALLGCKSQKQDQGIAPAASAAETNRTSPERVCAWLSDIGMAGGAWQNYFNEWSSGPRPELRPTATNVRACNSGRRELPDGSVMGFYAIGTETTVEEAWVTWKEVVANKSVPARDKFLEACDALNRKATGMSMAAAPKNAIETRESGLWEQNGVDVSVEVHQLAPGATARSVKCKVVPK